MLPSSGHTPGPLGATRTAFVITGTANPLCRQDIKLLRAGPCGSVSVYTMAPSPCSSHGCPGLPSTKQCHPHSGWVSPHQLNLSGNAFTDTLRGSLPVFIV
ncbi:hypothetical protein STEG23_033928 [Scotinomys teguina]